MSRAAFSARFTSLVGEPPVDPRPYPLAELAEAAGLGSHSSARTFYSEADITAVATTTGAKRRKA